MITVDGRTDVEKLVELLNVGTEINELDFKQTLNLRDKRDELDFVKDAVSMFNRYPGGYLVIGANDDGTPSELATSTDWAQFDGSNLTDKVRKYVDAPLTVISAIHELDGHTFCIVCFHSFPDGLPVPFSKNGQFQNESGKTQNVFREGDLFRRDGAQNRHIEYAQWNAILSRHDEMVRQEEAMRIDLLIDRITNALGGRDKTPPLVLGMDDRAFSDALDAITAQGDEQKLIRFVNKAATRIDERGLEISSLTAVAIHSVMSGMQKPYDLVIDSLYAFFLSIDPYSEDTAPCRLALVISLYEIGAALILAQRWDLISPLVNRPSREYAEGVRYASWLRQCQVTVSREHGFKGNESAGALISTVLDDIRKHPSLTPDYQDERATDTVNDNQLSDKDDSILDLLCSFDFLYCLCVYVAGSGDGGAFPACIAFSERRVANVSALVFGPNDKARRCLLPHFDDSAIANGLRHLLGEIHSSNTSAKYHFWGFDYSGSVNSFLRANPGTLEGN